MLFSLHNYDRVELVNEDITSKKLRLCESEWPIWLPLVVFKKARQTNSLFTIEVVF